MFLLRNFLFLEENNKKTGSYQILLISYSSSPFLWELSCLSRFFSNCLILICLYDLISFILCFSQTILLLHFSSFFISDFFPLLHFFVQPSLIGHSTISLPLIFLFFSNIHFYFFPYFFPFSLHFSFNFFNFFCISFSFILPSFHDSLLLFPVYSFSFLSFFLPSIFFPYSFFLSQIPYSKISAFLFLA